MELPFAMRYQSDDDSSLVTATSSQGSLLQTSSEQQHHQNTVDIVRAAAQQTTNKGLAAVLSQFGVLQEPSTSSAPEEVIDFTYVNVCETDEVDIIIAGGDDEDAVRLVPARGDVLALLLSGTVKRTDQLVDLVEQANVAAEQAAGAKKVGNLQQALDAHTTAAKLFRDAAGVVREAHNASLANSLLLLSQTQARSALALQRVIKLRPNSLVALTEQLHSGSKERLRATVRGALENPTEADMSDSAFLGKATGKPGTLTQRTLINNKDEHEPSMVVNAQDAAHNPVDEMMELERELRNMDMALEMGNSLASFDAKAQRMKHSVIDGSFMVVAPASQSYMSSSLWSSPAPTPPRTSSTATGARARNRVQNMLEASTTRPPVAAVNQPPSLPHPVVTAAAAPQSQKPHSLESSWWGNSSTASQVLANSVISITSAIGDHQSISSANTKQLIRLMDALKTLGDENATLLRQVEDAEAARMEAKAAKEQMKRFKEEYAQRFSSLKEALEKFRKGYPSSNGNEMNPVTSSDYVKSASVSEQIQRQEQLIKKLTADLKKEKEESKKKDAALRKYESFYREVKARSAQKAAERQKESQQQHRQPMPRPSGRGPR